MKRRKKRILVIALIFLAVLCACLLFYMKRERNAFDPPISIPKQVQKLANPSGKDKFYYLALGNSVTVHPADGELWWGNWGMAATSADRDYVHQVEAHLAQTYEVKTVAYDFKNWEISTARKDSLPELDPLLSKNLDLITIQLGENITDGFDTLPMDYAELVDYLTAKCPHVQIIFIDEFCWPKEPIQQAQQAACAQYGLAYVDLAEIRNDSYKAGLGTIVMGEDGAQHEISNEVVAAHPNDAGMTYIAEHIIPLIQTKESDEKEKTE